MTRPGGPDEDREGTADRAGAPTPDPVADADAVVEGPERRPRGPRRAMSTQTGAGRDGPAPALPGRSADDTDTGWGEPPADDDERFLQDVPPHW